MVTRRNRPEMDGTNAEEGLREALAQRTSEVQQLRQRIGDLELLGTRFLSAASHAVTNPITIIQSYLEIVLSDLQPGLSSEQNEFIATAHAATLRLNGIIESIVELAAIEMGAAELEMGALEVGDIVDEVCSTHESLAATGDVGLSATTAPNLPRARGDGNRLRNAVREVVLNAIQSTPPGGRVEIAVLHRGADIIVRVVDTGCGIPEDQLDAVCDPFVRLSGNRGLPQRGAGLGLSVARRQIEAMGGSVELSSKVGRGTSLEFRFPILTEDD